MVIGFRNVRSLVLHVRTILGVDGILLTIYPNGFDRSRRSQGILRVGIFRLLQRDQPRVHLRSRRAIRFPKDRAFDQVMSVSVARHSNVEVDRIQRRTIVQYALASIGVRVANEDNGHQRAVLYHVLCHEATGP